MDGPIIAFDVSKGSSHMQGYTEFGKPIGKPTVIQHDRKGFEEARDLAEKLEKMAGRKPRAVYEFTGVYSRVLERAMKMIVLTCYPLAPLLTSDQKKGVRKTKTDSIDCRRIASAYYTYSESNCGKPGEAAELIPAENKNTVGTRLREMAKEIDHLTCILIREKNFYRRFLDEIWPEFDTVATEPYSEFVLATVEKFGTPENVKSERGVLSAIKDLHGGKTAKGKAFAEKTAAYAKSHISGVDPDSFDIESLQNQAAKIRTEAEEISALKEKMAEEASSLNETKLLQTIPGVGEFIAAGLMACIRDIRRFPNAKALIGYAGLDPEIRQSGTMSGKHLPITKKGDPMLRKYLYLAVTAHCCTKSSKDSDVAVYVARKKKSGLPPKVAKIAGCSKLLRIIYAMLRNAECFDGSRSSRQK